MNISDRRISEMQRYNNLNRNTDMEFHDRVMEQHQVPNVNNMSYPNQIHLKNHSRIINPLLPPERSFENTYGIPINIDTRGSSGGFQQVGFLRKNSVTDESNDIGNNNDSVILPLYGRPLYPGSKKWNYYTSSDKYHSVKMPITHNGRKCDSSYGCDEIYSGDTIELPAYNASF